MFLKNENNRLNIFETLRFRGHICRTKMCKIVFFLQVFYVRNKCLKELNLVRIQNYKKLCGV